MVSRKCKWFKPEFIWIVFMIWATASHLWLNIQVLWALPMLKPVPTHFWTIGVSICYKFWGLNFKMSVTFADIFDFILIKIAIFNWETTLNSNSWVVQSLSTMRSLQQYHGSFWYQCIWFWKNILKWSNHFSLNFCIKSPQMQRAEICQCPHLVVRDENVFLGRTIKFGI